MDKNLEVFIEDTKIVGQKALSMAQQIEIYLKGRKNAKKNEWVKADDYKPEDDDICLVTWWDYEKGKYHQPIRAIWHQDGERFFALDALQCIAIEVDIWCYFPDVPEERL